MMEKHIEYIQKLRPLLPKKSDKELEQILMYGKEVIAEGKSKKKEFWRNNNILDFRRLLEYKRKHREEIEGKYEYLAQMNDIERNKFIEEFLHDDILYSGKLTESGFTKEKCSYEKWKQGHIEVKEGMILDFSDSGIGIRELKDIAKIKLKEFVTLNLNGNKFGPQGAKILAENLEFKDGVILTLNGNKMGPEGAKAFSNIKLKCGVDLNLSNNEIGDEGVEILISDLKLKEGVRLDLGHNQIGPKGAKAIAKNMKLKDGVILTLWDNEIGDEGAKVIAENLELRAQASLDLSRNHIGDEGAKAIANMELKEGVKLDLSNNDIGYMGVRAILNMKLKNGVFIDLSDNKIGKTMKSKLESWVEFYKKQGIECEIRI